ncbi:hypothetical protein MTR_3g117260 [Medicago truncatula]|uniref:Uncharacterized protein n=1 Tax=Medicago truncatula TaxID=3880 RepID=G7J7Q9_MEDTR|nr:hypothetical protein MTR_3g117260 [Medicago truncatula]
MSQYSTKTPNAPQLQLKISNLKDQIPSPLNTKYATHIHGGTIRLLPNRDSKSRNSAIPKKQRTKPVDYIHSPQEAAQPHCKPPQSTGLLDTKYHKSNCAENSIHSIAQTHLRIQTVVIHVVI